MFRLAPIEEAYWKLSYGYDEPDQLRASQATVNELPGLTLTVEGYFYLEAKVIVDEDIPEGTVELRNSKWMARDSSIGQHHSKARIVLRRD